MEIMAQLEKIAAVEKIAVDQEVLFAIAKASDGRENLFIYAPQKVKEIFKGEELEQLTTRVFRDGLDYEAIGEQLGRSAEAARKLIQRALAQLRRLTEGDEAT